MTMRMDWREAVMGSGAASQVRGVRMGSSLLRLSIVTGLLLSASTVVAKKEKGPVDEAVEKFRAAHERKKESPPGPIVLSADDCRSCPEKCCKFPPRIHKNFKIQNPKSKIQNSKFKIHNCPIPCQNICRNMP